MSSLKNLKESMGCNTIRDDHNGGVVYQHVHMDKATFDKMLAEVEEEYSALQSENAKLRELVNSYADSFERDAAINNGCGPYYSGEDWLALANDMRIELAECCSELRVEVDG